MESRLGTAHADAADETVIAAAPWRRMLPAVLLLAVLFAAMRFEGMLGPSSLRPLLPASFILMMLAPWLLLNRDGRRDIGLRAPASWWWVVPAVLAGALAALACFALGMVFFGPRPDNWFVTVAASYRGMMDTSRFSMPMLYLVFTAPALLFSPIGEEIFFRGLLQRALESRCSRPASTVLECAAFGLVHLCHHGLFYGATGLALRPVSGVSWVALMFLTALLLATLRQRTGSLFPAMAAHAAFNATMNGVIFAFLWR
jgi:membrane protease YdiL (CAAX protease family)